MVGSGQSIKGLECQAKELLTCPVGKGEDPTDTSGQGEQGL